MNRKYVHVSLSALLLFVLLAAGFATLTSVAQETTPPHVFAGDKVLKELVDYRQWTRANDLPLPVTNALLSGAVLVSDFPTGLA